MTKDIICEGDLAEIVGRSHYHHIVRIEAGKEIQSHKGVIKMDALIGLPWGSKVQSHNGNTFFVLQPAMNDMIKDIPRATQILYPKDIGFVLMSLSVTPGQRIVEAGTGSGALTSAFANAVGDSGKVYTYERRPEMQKKAIENVARVGLDHRVEFKFRDIAEGFDEKNVDALFLDVPNSYDYMPQVKRALKPGGFFGGILPTTQQVTLLLKALRENGFAFTEVCEVLLRYWQVDPEKFRPADRMVGHTGFLIFSRSLAYKAEVGEAELIQKSGEERG